MRNSRSWVVAAALVASIAATVARASESDWFVDADAGFTQDSNATRAAWTRDIIEDAVTGIAAGAAWNLEFSPQHALTLRGFAEAEQHADLPSLDHAALGLQGIYRWQGALGFTRPFWQASLAMQRDDVDADLRDNDRYTLQVFRTRRVTTAFRYALGGEGWYQDANGRVFDGSQFRVFVNGDLQLSNRVALYGTYSVASGDTVSSAQQVFCNGVLAGDIYPLITAAEELEPDEALNNDTCGTWLAYRMPALTHAVVGGVNIGLGHRLSIDVSALHALVQAEENIEYRRTLLRAGVLVRF